MKIKAFPSLNSKKSFSKLCMASGAHSCVVSLFQALLWALSGSLSVSKATEQFFGCSFCFWMLGSGLVLSPGDLSRLNRRGMCLNFRIGWKCPERWLQIPSLQCSTTHRGAVWRPAYPLYARIGLLLRSLEGVKWGWEPLRRRRQDSRMCSRGSRSLPTPDGVPARP